MTDPWGLPERPHRPDSWSQPDDPTVAYPVARDRGPQFSGSAGAPPPGHGPPAQGHWQAPAPAPGGAWQGQGPPPGGAWQGRRPPPAATRPGLLPIVLVTLFLGLVGIIPTARSAARARELRFPAGSYWRSFVVTFVLSLLLYGGLFALWWTQFRTADEVDGLSDAPPAVTATTTTGAGSGMSEGPTAPSDPTTPAPSPSPSPTSDPRTVTSLPSGGWITILDSFPKPERTEADAWSLAESLPGAVVIDSDRIPGLNGGYWAVALTGSSSRSEAASACSRVGRSVGGECYPRQVG